MYKHYNYLQWWFKQKVLTKGIKKCQAAGLGQRDLVVYLKDSGWSASAKSEVAGFNERRESFTRANTYNRSELLEDKCMYVCMCDFIFVCFFMQLAFSSFSDSNQSNDWQKSSPILIY